MDTYFGPIVAEIFVDKAPITARNFLHYVDQDLYRGAAFYRALRPDNGTRLPKLRVIQGGIDPTALHPPLQPIAHETTEVTGLHHVDGALSLVRWSPGSGASEFFIVIGESPEFDFGGAYDEGFAVFGRVIAGMDVVRKINESPTGNVLPIDYLKDAALLKPVPMRIRRIP